MWCRTYHFASCSSSLCPEAILHHMPGWLRTHWHLCPSPCYCSCWLMRGAEWTVPLPQFLYTSKSALCFGILLAVYWVLELGGLLKKPSRVDLTPVLSDPFCSVWLAWSNCYLSLCEVMHLELLLPDSRSLIEMLNRIMPRTNRIRISTIRNTHIW